MPFGRIPTRWLLLIFGLFLLISLAPLLAPHDPDAASLSNRLQGINLQYPLGTDHMGRCVLSRLLYGFHVTPIAAFLIVAISASFGSLVGLLSGYTGGFIDQIVMRVVEGVFIFPAIAVALTIGRSGAGHERYHHRVGYGALGRIRPHDPKYRGGRKATHLCSGGSNNWCLTAAHRVSPYPAQCAAHYFGADPVFNVMGDPVIFRS